MDFLTFDIIVAMGYNAYIVAMGYNAYLDIKKQNDRFNSDEFYRENAWKFGLDPDNRKRRVRNGNTKKKMD